MLQLDYKSGISICDQIVNGIIRLKAIGVLNAGDQLPSVRSFALQLSVNPNTIQKAYQILEVSGIIYSVKAKGSFIADDKEADRAIAIRAKKNFSESVREAKALGLTRNDLTEIINQNYEGGTEQ